VCVYVYIKHLVNSPPCVGPRMVLPMTIVSYILTYLLYMYTFIYIRIYRHRYEDI